MDPRTKVRALWVALGVVTLLLIVEVRATLIWSTSYRQALACANAGQGCRDTFTARCAVLRCIQNSNFYADSSRRDARDEANTANCPDQVQCGGGGGASECRFPRWCWWKDLFGIR